MEELETSEEEIEIEVEEEVEVEVEEEDEEPDENKNKEKKENDQSTQKQERKSIMIKKKVSQDYRKDILLRASLSDKSNPKLLGKNINNKDITQFNIDNYLNKINSQSIKENYKDENDFLYEDRKQISYDNILNDKEEEINHNKTKEEEEYIEKIKNIVNTNEIEDLLESKKWEDKKLGLIKLNEFIEQSSEIMPNLDTFIIYIKHKLNNFKETNFNIIKEGMKCFCTIFNKINRSDKPNQKYIEIILNGLKEKIADPKLKDVYIELLDSLMNSYSEKIIIDTLLNLIDKCKKVIVLKEYAEYIDKIIEDKLCKNVDLNLKGIIAFLVNLANNSNPQLRAVSTKVICHLYKYIGEDLKLLIKNIKESTLKNIYKEMEKINEDNLKKNQDNNNKNKIIIKEKLIKPENISEYIPPKLLKEIDKGKWQEKKDGIDYISKVIENGKKKILPDGLQNLFELIQQKLTDANKNFVRMIIQLLSFLIMSLGDNIKTYSKQFVKPLLLNLSDKNQLLREDCVKCINILIENENFEIITDFLPQITDIENSDMRNEILNLLISNINSLLNDNYSDSFFKELKKALINFLQDKNSKIKSKTETFIKMFKDKLKKKDYLKEIDKYKPSIAEDLRNIFNKIFPENNEKQNEKQNEKEKEKVKEKVKEKEKEKIKEKEKEKDKDKDKDKDKLQLKKFNSSKKAIPKNNPNPNNNNQIKKIDINKKTKTNQKDLKLDNIKQINKSVIVNTPKARKEIKTKNNSTTRRTSNIEDEEKTLNKTMSKTMSNWQKSNDNKKIDKNKNNVKEIKNKPRLSIDDSNISNNNKNSHHERMKTDSNQKAFKLSKEKPIKTERNQRSNLNLNKKDNIKKIPINKNSSIPSLKKGNHKLTSSLNNSLFKKEPKTKNSNNSIKNQNKNNVSLTSSLNTSLFKKDTKIKNNNNSNKKQNKNNDSLNKEYLINLLNSLLKNENDITSSLLNIHSIVYKNFNENKDLLIKNSDKIFQTFIDLIKKLFAVEKPDIKLLKYVTNVFRKISGIKELINSISFQTHINLINIVFYFVLYEEKNKLEEDEEGIIVWKGFNSIMIHIIDYCNYSENICILIQLITLNIKENQQKLSEYGSRCLELMNRTIKDIYNQLKINEILKEIHLFLIEYEKKNPNLEGNNEKNKIIIENIENLLYELVKAKKNSIIDIYNKEFKNIGQEDKYILKWIKDDLNKIKEKEIEEEIMISNIDDGIENLISEELLTS